MCHSAGVTRHDFEFRMAGRGAPTQKRDDETKKPPPGSLSAGCDYGNREAMRGRGLTSLSVVERMLLADVRPYYTVVKVKAQGLTADAARCVLKGHVVCFMHDSAEALLSVLSDVSTKRIKPPRLHADADRFL